jgi:hypothetical protein
MTNGEVGQSVTSVDGPVLTLKYKDGEKKIIVGSSVPIVKYEIADKNDLKAGKAIAVNAATKNPDGTFTTNRINVDRGGMLQ